MWQQNEISKRLKINYPIIQAGMAGGPTTPQLVSAVSNAGGLGTLGAGYMTPEQTRSAIEEIRRLTGHSFGVNLFVPEAFEWDEGKVEASNRLLRPVREKLNLDNPSVSSKPSSETFLKQIEIIVQTGVPACTFTFGIPDKRVIDRLKDRHIAVIGTATTVEEAILNETAGMDMVVVQGSEAGGHRGSFAVPYEQGMIGTMALVPQAADQVHIPVIAAGGIMDGRGVLAALVLGAEAVQMGTAFVTCEESGADERHKEMILKSAENETAITSAFSGKPARGIRNAFIDLMEGKEKLLPDYPVQNALTKDIRAAAGKVNRPEWMSMWSGQGPRLSRRMPAGAKVREIVSEVEHHLEMMMK
ncbi:MULTISPECIES: NAD(P)H-dependent flavin oxidoreductase [unclassified Sporolactobacillus]|uniref:NAD(P)H-dependent flavin oxidoreductase n=1 Tax=unclassified Sporolactobacillus TaxID=2628533 RepID=UPI00236835DD|nr:nitronate monooxygenase [Sporolactobacillus sp. CQH2019]MDD9149152.1 nitronate monooxygenase [Sporolactobacillus sp. CQH2019]